MNIKKQIEVYNFEERVGRIPSMGYTIWCKYMDTDNFILCSTIRNEIEFHMDILNETRE